MQYQYQQCTVYSQEGFYFIRANDELFVLGSFPFGIFVVVKLPIGRLLQWRGTLDRLSGFAEIKNRFSGWLAWPKLQLCLNNVKPQRMQWNWMYFALALECPLPILQSLHRGWGLEQLDKWINCECAFCEHTFSCKEVKAFRHCPLAPVIIVDKIPRIHPINELDPTRTIRHDCNVVMEIL